MTGSSLFSYIIAYFPCNCLCRKNVKPSVGKTKTETKGNKCEEIPMTITNGKNSQIVSDNHQALNLDEGKNDVQKIPQILVSENDDTLVTTEKLENEPDNNNLVSNNLTSVDKVSFIKDNEVKNEIESKAKSEPKSKPKIIFFKKKAKPINNKKKDYSPNFEANPKLKPSEEIVNKSINNKIKDYSPNFEADSKLKSLEIFANNSYKNKEAINTIDDQNVSIQNNSSNKSEPLNKIELSGFCSNDAKQKSLNNSDNSLNIDSNLNSSIENVKEQNHENEKQNIEVDVLDSEIVDENNRENFGEQNSPQGALALYLKKKIKASTLDKKIKTVTFEQYTVANNSNKNLHSSDSHESKLKEAHACNDESGNSLRSSPHGRLRIRNRSLSGGSEDGRQRKSSVPHISVSECTEQNQTGKVSAASSEKDSSGVQDDDVDQVFAYHSRSQMSLSSFGGRSESVTSVYSAAGGGRYGTVTVTGEVLFGLSYNYKTVTLEIAIKECRNLAPVDTKRNRSDPYVKIYLLPDRTKSGKRKTKVKKHTLNPVFDEVLKFHVTISELETRTLWLSVWHSDRFGRNDFLGEVMLPLGYDTFEDTGLKWFPLQERLENLDTPVSYKGDLILSLKFVPPDVTSRKHPKKPGDQAKGALHVLVREARNLMATRSNGTSDPFCKSYLLPDKSKSGKQKTPVFKKSCSPNWNHTFVYEDVTIEDLKERCLELTIWDYDKITSNDFLGGVRLCLGTGKYQGRDVDWMDSIGEERSLWYTMLERPNTWVDGSLLLRPNMQSRRTV